MGVGQAIDLAGEDLRSVLALLERYLPGTEAWAYGSRVKWTSRPQSDLDLVVFAMPEQRRRVGDLREAFEESNLPFRVDLFVWDEVPVAFREQIRAEHVVIARVGTCSGWREVAIGEIADIVGGGTPSTRNPKNFGGSIPWLTPRDLSGTHDRCIERGKRNLSRQGLDGSSAKLLPTGAVLLSTRAPIGYVALAKNPIATNQGFRSLVARNGTLPEFLYYWLKLNTEELERHASGSTFRELSGSALKDIRLGLPPFPEQRAIAHVLGTLDDRIEVNRRMSATLEQMARALFKSWFVDFDPVRAKMAGRDTGLPQEIADLFPDRMVDSELGKIPEGWEVGQVSDICQRIENGGTPKRAIAEYWNGDVKWFKTSELVDGPLLDSSEHITALGLEKSSCKLWPAGTVVVALYASPTVGRLGILGVPAAANQACCALIAKPDFGRLFLFYVLLFGRPHLQNIAVGSAQQDISPRIVRDHQLILPPAGIAREFDRLAKPIYLQRVMDISESRTLSALRDTLLPKLISGEIRVPYAERVVESVT